MKSILGIVIFMVFNLTFMPSLASAGEWGLGAAIAYNQPPQKDVESYYLALPYFTYHGERLNIDLGTVSYTLLSGEVQISLEGELRFPGYDPDDSESLKGMKKRDLSLDTGMSVARAGSWGEIKLTLLGDVTGTHDGFEARAQYQMPYMINRFFIAPTIGISWLDSALVDYYYGVQLDEATSSRSRYAGSSATNAFIGVTMGYALSDHLELLGGLRYERLGENIAASPIMDKSHENMVSTLPGVI